MRELTDREVEQVSGGGGVEVNWGMVTTGLAMIGLGVAIASTSGLAGVAVPLILGAGTGWEIGVGVAAVSLAGGGSILSGSAISVSFGFLARAVPQMNVLIFGSPVRIGAGLGVFLIFLPATFTAIKGMIQLMQSRFLQLLTGGGA